MEQNALTAFAAEAPALLTAEHILKLLDKPIEVASSARGTHTLHYVPSSGAFMLRRPGCPVAFLTGFSVEEIVNAFNCPT